MNKIEWEEKKKSWFPRSLSSSISVLSPSLAPQFSSEQRQSMVRSNVPWVREETLMVSWARLTLLQHFSAYWRILASLLWQIWLKARGSTFAIFGIVWDSSDHFMPQGHFGAHKISFTHDYIGMSLIFFLRSYKFHINNKGSLLPKIVHFQST